MSTRINVYRSSVIVPAAVLVIGGVMMASHLCGQPQRETPAQQDAEDDDDDELLPLTLDAGTVRPLEGPGEQDEHWGPVAPSVAENVACYVCHANYESEELVAIHARGGVGCVDCHGKSYDHRNDENHTTPPDVMIPRAQLDPSCAQCHDSHDVSAAEVVRRLQERSVALHDPQPPVCTDCHGHHRLAHRTVVWDRTTRALLSTNTAAAELASPVLPAADIDVLAGTWVRVGPPGQPPARVTITLQDGRHVQAAWESSQPAATPQVLTLRAVPQVD